jgi:signal peptidase I
MPDQPGDNNKTNEEKAAEAASKADRKSEAKGWIISIAAAVVIALALRFFVFEFIRVEGPSMQPTLYTDEYVFMERVTYWFGPPERGDIVICMFPGSSQTYVKRVIGEPGDSIKIEDGVLYINNAPNYDYFGMPHDRDMEELIVPVGSVIVMGDNRNDSTDSRDIGPIPLERVLGKALFIIWPPGRIHGL